MASETSLLPVQEHGWRRGLANLLRKDLGAWWGTAAWWKQGLLWLIIINGGVFLIATALPGAAPEGLGMDDPAAVALEFFMVIAGLAPVIGLIVVTQSAIIGEKQAGTAAWILSKPVSRSAFVLSKLIAYGLGFFVAGAALPGLVAYGQILLLAGEALPVGLFALGVGMLVLNLLFYLGLMLMLGTLLEQRGQAAGIGIAVLLAGGMLPNVWPQVVAYLPWRLPDFGVILISTGGLPDIGVTAVIATVLWTILFVAVALWRFGRQEF